MHDLVIKIQASEIMYPIKIGEHLLLNPKEWLPRDAHSKKIVIITDDHIHLLYGQSLVIALAEFKPLLFDFSAGEIFKTQKTKQMLEEHMLNHHCDRDTLILALGGGVVGDLAGFIAATYMRGIAYIQIPTSLLAMVDSSVGGKNGINVPQGKNLIGTLWQPSAVIIDTTCLMTLSEIHLINGLIEALKMFMTHSLEDFNYVDIHLDRILNKDRDALNHIVKQAVSIKANIVSFDEKEQGQRLILNFGHTIGHALEKISNYTILHGYAVAIGILVEAKASELLGILPAKEYQRIRSLFSKLNMDGTLLNKMNTDEIMQAMQSDKKIKFKQVRYILLKTIGEYVDQDDAFAYPIAEDIIKQALIHVCEGAS